MNGRPIIALVVPCFNEEKSLLEMAPAFVGKVRSLMEREMVSADSFVLFCDDGSRDATWNIIRNLAAAENEVRGISLSRNRGQQNALMAGMMEVKDTVDAAISLDCDGQDDIDAIDEMIGRFKEGADIVYGVRCSRETDSWFKRTTAGVFYGLMRALGAEVVENHADFRLVSSRVLQELSRYGETSLFLRGLMPQLGFASSIVRYRRLSRAAGDSHYSLGKMFSFAWDGAVSSSARPLRLIGVLGLSLTLLGLMMIGWCLVSHIAGRTMPGWAGGAVVGCLIGGVQLVSLGIIAEYVGRIYLEARHRPRYCVAERTPPLETEPGVGKD